MDRDVIVKLVAAVVLLGLAGFMIARHFRQDYGVSEKAFFYDLSEQKLFTAQRDLIPPTQGVNDAQEDAVRAVVISTNGNPKDKSSWKVAYLEMYSPELKKQMEAARVAGGSPSMDRDMARSHRFVRRLSDSQWRPMISPEAERIVGEWLTAGPGGAPAVICTP